MKHVQQTNAHNCGSAILAMIFETSCDDVEKRMHRDPSKRYPSLRNHEYWPDDPNREIPTTIGWSNDEICFALFKAGIPTCHTFDRTQPGSSAALCGDECAKTKPTIGECMGWLHTQPDLALIMGVDADHAESQFGHWILATVDGIHDPFFPGKIEWEQSSIYQVNAGTILADLRKGHLPSTFIRTTEPTDNDEDDTGLSNRHEQ